MSPPCCTMNPLGNDVTRVLDTLARFDDSHSTFSHLTEASALFGYLAEQPLLLKLQTIRDAIRHRITHLYRLLREEREKADARLEGNTEAHELRVVQQSQKLEEVLRVIEILYT